MNYTNNQNCNSNNYCGCGQQYPVVPGSNPSLQTWNGQRFVVADGSYQLPIYLPNLQQYDPTQVSNVIGMSATGQLVRFADVQYAPNNALVTATGSTTPRTLANRFADVVNVKDFGAVGDGVTDDTAAIQAALTSTYSNNGGRGIKLLFSAGTYLITSSLTTGSNQFLQFDPSVIINLVPLSNNETTSAFNSSNQTNVVFDGNGATINGYRSGANPSIEGNAAAFFVYGSDNVTIRNFNINNFSTDGITIAGDNSTSGPSTNVLIEGVVCNNNRRNGLSITHANGVTIFNGKYINSNGSPNGPFAGIDVEPNINNYAQNINIIGVYTQGNIGGGLLFVPSAQSNVSNTTYSVTVNGGKSFQDGSAINIPALRFAGGTFSNQINGSVSVSNYTIENPQGRGVDLTNWDANLAPQVICTNVNVLNPGSNASASTNQDLSGFVIDGTTSSLVTNLGNARFTNCSVIDLRGAYAKMISGFWINTISGKTTKNINIVDPNTFGQIVYSGVDVLLESCLVTNGSNNVTVFYTNGKKYSSTATLTNFGIFAGITFEATEIPSTGQNLSLPLAANCINTTYKIQTGSTGGNISIIPSGSDSFVGLAPYGGNIILSNGGYVELCSLGGTSWQIKNITSEYFLTGSVTPARIIWSSVNAPTTGRWNVGDIAFNKTSTVGSPKGWMCTVAGTPGTWVSMGNL